MEYIDITLVGRLIDRGSKLKEIFKLGVLIDFAANMTSRKIGAKKGSKNLIDNSALNLL